MNQGVLSPCFQCKAPAPVKPSPELPHPKPAPAPAPAPLGPGAILPDPWAILGHRHPKALPLSTPNINLQASSPPNIASAISQPPLMSVNILKLCAAVEAKAHAIAEIKASLEALRVSIEASKTSNSMLSSLTLPDQDLLMVGPNPQHHLICHPLTCL